ncbi:MAG: hypothetical protein ACUVRL_06945 [Candidatus Saccharicenans sp.]
MARDGVDDIIKAKTIKTEIRIEPEMVLLIALADEVITTLSGPGELLGRLAWLAASGTIKLIFRLKF